MTKDQLNEAIAIHFGWSKCACGDEHCGAWFPPNTGDRPEPGVPDFLTWMKPQVDEYERARAHAYGFKYPVLSKEEADAQRESH